MPRETLRRALAGRSLLMFDFDGTLAPIARRPSAARMRPSTRRLLAAVAVEYPTIVLTGREGRDAARMLRGVPLRLIVGNHGLDIGGSRTSGTVAAWARQLRAQQRALPGVFMEYKSLSIAAHYRGVADPAATRRRILCVAQGLRPRPWILPSKASVNLVPDVGLNKGTALGRLMQRFRASKGLYVGDDATDEDAFVTGATWAVLTVRVGTSAHTAAQFALPSQGRIDDLLARLAEVRGLEPKRSTVARPATRRA